MMEEINFDDFHLKDYPSYDHKFLNRTKGQKQPNWIGRYRIGNATSPSYSRPSGRVLCKARLNQKQINVDIEQHQAIDNHTVNVPLYRKTSIQTLISHNMKPRQSSKMIHQ